MPVFSTSQSILKKNNRKNIQRMWWISKTPPKRPGVIFFPPPWDTRPPKSCKKSCGRTAGPKRPVRYLRFDGIGFRIRWDVGKGLEGEGWARWWFQIFFIFTFTWGFVIQFDEHIFQIWLVQPPTRDVCKHDSLQSSSKNRSASQHVDLSSRFTRPLRDVCENLEPSERMVGEISSDLVVIWL